MPTIFYHEDVSGFDSPSVFCYYRQKKDWHQWFYLFSTNLKYDHDSYEKLPDAIVGLNKAYYLQKGYADVGRDMLGYNSFIWVDEENKEISCLEEFVSAILNIVAEYSNIPKSIIYTEHSEKYMMSADISKCTFIPLFDM